MTLPKWLALLALCAACLRGKPPVPILDYHSVGPRTDEFAITDAQFEEELDWLQAAGFRTVSLHEALAPSARAVVLTFDDGKEDALTHVLPALRKRGMKGAFFVITGSVGRPGFLTWDGVRALAAAGMEIGSHTVHHRPLAELSRDELRAELVASRQELETALGRPVDLLAYPYNQTRARLRDDVAAAGYRIAVAGAAHGGKDPLQLLRISVTSGTTMEQFRRIVSD